MATWRHMVRSSLVFTSLVSLSKAASTNRGMHWTVRTLHTQQSKIKLVLLYFNSVAHKHRWHKIESFLTDNRSQIQRWNENVKICNHMDFVTSCTANVTFGSIIYYNDLDSKNFIFIPPYFKAMSFDIILSWDRIIFIKYSLELI